MTAAVALHDQVDIRPARAGDERLILSSWLESFRDCSRTANLVPKPFYFPLQREVSTALLRRGEVLVACNPMDADQIFGWAVVERIARKPVLHYVYVKQLFRRMGIASALLNAADCVGGFYTHHTVHAPAISRRFRLTLNPYLAGAVP